MKTGQTCNYPAFATVSRSPQISRALVIHTGQTCDPLYIFFSVKKEKLVQQ